MTDNVASNTNKNPELNNSIDAKKKHSFFWWSINSLNKDVFDFSKNTQEEIDQLNENIELDELNDSKNVEIGNLSSISIEDAKNFQNEVINKIEEDKSESNFEDVEDEKIENDSDEDTILDWEVNHSEDQKIDKDIITAQKWEESIKSMEDINESDLNKKESDFLEDSNDELNSENQIESENEEISKIYDPFNVDFEEEDSIIETSQPVESNDYYDNETEEIEKLEKSEDTKSPKFFDPFEYWGDFDEFESDNSDENLSNEMQENNLDRESEIESLDSSDTNEKNTTEIDEYQDENSDNVISENSDFYNNSYEADKSLNWENYINEKSLEKSDVDDIGVSNEKTFTQKNEIEFKNEYNNEEIKNLDDNWESQEIEDIFDKTWDINISKEENEKFEDFENNVEKKEYSVDENNEKEVYDYDKDENKEDIYDIEEDKQIEITDEQKVKEDESIYNKTSKIISKELEEDKYDEVEEESVEEVDEEKDEEVDMIYINNLSSENVSKKTQEIDLVHEEDIEEIDEIDEDETLWEEEIFEQEPEFFADDEISQKFFELVKNSREIFKYERKNWENEPYFKIIWSKSQISILDYLFYLIEEPWEPLDLYIKKTIINSESEEEHMLQFSYDWNKKELMIFVDEAILYETINKLDNDSVELRDTKMVLEKFIFLTQTYLDKIKWEREKLQEEKKRKKQLHHIFKGF